MSILQIPPLMPFTPRSGSMKSVEHPWRTARSFDTSPKECPDRLLGEGIPEFQHLVRRLPRDAMEVTECGTRCTSFRPQVADSLERRGARDYRLLAAEMTCS